VLLEPDAKPLEAPQVGLLNVRRRRLENDLELQVLAQPERVLAVPAVGRPPRRLDIGAPPGIGAEDLQERRRVHGTRAHGHVVGLLDQAPLLLPERQEIRDQPLEREHVRRKFIPPETPVETANSADVIRRSKSQRSKVEETL
jgi:hypothetical protein